jgi:hypothetical protein
MKRRAGNVGVGGSRRWIGATAALLLLLACACSPEPADDDDTTAVADDDDSTAIDDDDATSPDDDDVVNDDDATTDDDDSGGPVCIDGYQPLAVIDGFDGPALAIGLQATPPTLAVLTETEIRLFDVVEPRTPQMVATFAASGLGEDGIWVDVAPADWGFVLVGQTEDQGECIGHVMSILLDPSPVLGPVASFGMDDDCDSNTYMGAVAAEADVVAVGASLTEPTDGGVVRFYGADEASGAVSLVSVRELPSPAWRGGLALEGTTALMPNDIWLHLVPMDAEDEIARAQMLNGRFMRPLPLADGWFVPTTGTGLSAPLYLLDVATATVEQIGQTETSSTGYYADGAWQGTSYEGELFLAQVAEGLVRTEWDPPNIDASGISSSHTTAIFTEGLGLPGPGGLVRIERIDDTLFVLGALGVSVPPVGILRICSE